MSISLNIKHQQKNFLLDLETTIPSSGLSAIFGPSGSGKTTLLRCIAGLNHAHGVIKLNQTMWLDSASGVKLEAHQRNIAYVFQESRLLPHLTSLENIQLARKLRRLDKTPSSFENAIESCGIGSLLDHYPSALSGGQKQRVCLARSLASEPALILMDEPLSALDSDAKKEMLRHLKSFKSNTSIPILYVSHSIDEVAQLADYLAILKEGKIQCQGPALDVFANHPEHFGASQLASVIEAEVDEIDAKHQLVSARLYGLNESEHTKVWLSEKKLKVGQKIRLRVAARDISISLEENTRQSILNNLSASIHSIRLNEQTRVATITLKIDDNVLHSQITQRSLDRLALKEGQQVWAQIKALSVFD